VRTLRCNADTRQGDVVQPRGGFCPGNAVASSTVVATAVGALGGEGKRCHEWFTLLEVVGDSQP